MVFQIGPIREKREKLTRGQIDEINEAFQIGPSGYDRETYDTEYQREQLYPEFAIRNNGVLDIQETVQAIYDYEEYLRKTDMFNLYLQFEVDNEFHCQKSIIYVDKYMFTNEISLQRVKKYYKEKFELEKIYFVKICLSDLERMPIAKFPNAEALFKKQGFVSQGEFSFYGAGQKEGNTNTVFLKRNRAAVFQQFHILTFICPTPDDSLRIDGNLADIDFFIGKSGKANVPLYRRNNIIFPLSKASDKTLSKARFAWCTDIYQDTFNESKKIAIETAEEDPFRLVLATSYAVKDQVEWETTNCDKVHSRATRQGLLLWQVQIIGYIRKIAWEIKLHQGPTYYGLHHAAKRKILNNRENAARGQAELLGVSLPRNDAIADLRHQAADGGAKHTRYESEYADSLGQLECAMGALHGSTYTGNFIYWDPNDCGLYERHFEACCKVASWIGNLKRHRSGSLNYYIASMLSDLWANTDHYDPWYEYPMKDQKWITDRFGKLVWVELKKACDQILALPDGTKIDIVYEWTRDAEQPWAAEWHGDILKITGPLLDFPISEAEKWNAAAEELARPKA